MGRADALEFDAVTGKSRWGRMGSFEFGVRSQPLLVNREYAWAELRSSVASIFVAKTGTPVEEGMVRASSSAIRTPSISLPFQAPPVKEGRSRDVDVSLRPLC